MRRSLSFSVLAFALVTGCSSTSLDYRGSSSRLPLSIERWAEGKDPLSVEFRLREMYEAAPSEEMEWWTLYNQAKVWMETDPAKSCQNFKILSGKTAFPLFRLAIVHSLEVCPANDSTLPSLGEVLRQTSEPWLQEMVKTTVLARAVASGNREIEMQLSAELVDHRALQSDKVRLLQRAIELARALNRADQLTAFQEKLIRIAPRFNTNPAPTDFIRVATDLRQARQFERARQMYERAIASDAVADLDKLRAIDGIRLAYKNERKVDQYLAANTRMVQFARVRFLRAPSDRTWIDKYHDAGILLARAIWTEKSVAEAQRTLNELEADLGARKEHDEINWVRARIEEEAGRFAEAVRIFEGAVTPGNPNQALIEKIVWYKAWNLRKLNRHQEAVVSLRVLNEHYASVTAKSRNQYWLGKSFLALQENSKAAEEFESIIRNDPLSYYALLSYRELGRDLPAAKAPDSDSTERKPWPGSNDSPFASRADHDYVEWLISVGEDRVGQQFIDYYVGRNGQKNPNTPAGRELLKYYARTGSYKVLFARIQSFPPEIRNQLLDETPSLLFPQPFSRFLTEPSRKFGVEMELSYSITRQESSFDPFARSPADAFGLMQLIPEAARRVEGKTGIRIINPEQLYKPELNLPIGTAFVRLLMDRFGEQFIPTVAAYNASENAIRGWIRTRYRGNTLEFIEDIPYEETKTYVKLVMRNYIFYRRINSGGRDLPFPEWCLEALHPLNY